MLKKLKIVQPGFEGYNGPIGAYEFQDGISVEHLPRAERDRLSVAFAMVEVDEAGEETPAGVAHRLVAESEERVAHHGALQRQTEEEKEAEQAQDRAKAKLAADPDRPIYTREQLMAVADEKGIKGLRELAEPWAVKHKSMVVLIQMILDAQDEWSAKRDKIRAEKEAALAELRAQAEQAGEIFEGDLPILDDAPAAPAPTAEPATEPVAEPGADPFVAADGEDEDDLPAIDAPVTPSVEDAAASGDLSAALSDEG